MNTIKNFKTYTAESLRVEIIELNNEFHNLTVQTYFLPPNSEEKKKHGKKTMKVHKRLGKLILAEMKLTFEPKEEIEEIKEEVIEEVIEEIKEEIKEKPNRKKRVCKSRDFHCWVCLKGYTTQERMWKCDEDCLYKLENGTLAKKHLNRLNDDYERDYGYKNAYGKP